MGTSLSGLTPATTFDGLLKTSDNEPLDGTLKPISTGDGTDTILSLSNSALQIGGATTVVSDNTGNDIPFEVNTSSSGLLKIRNLNSATTPILGISHGSQDTRLSMYTTMGFRVQGVGIADMTSSEVRIGGGSGARLAVKGSGATSATTSLLVQNSAGSDLLKVTDDGKLTLGDTGNNGYISILRGLNGAQVGYIEGQSSGVMISMANNSNQLFLSNSGIGIGETNPTAKLQIKGDGTGTANYSFKVQNAIGNNNMQIRDDGAVFLTNQRYTFNAAGGAVFKGSGATSATTALLVQNSAGTDLFKVEDDGNVSLGNLSIKGSIITGNAYFSNIVFGPNYYRQTNGAITIGRGSGAVASAVLELDSTTKGFLPPRMTQAQRDAITTPAAGLMIYNTDTNTAECYNGTAWIPMF